MTEALDGMGRVTYEKPTLVNYGSVRQLTAGCKDFDGDDGFHLQDPNNTLGDCPEVS